ncbi:fasciclin domain-containing protein [Subsaxibacter sp. CAU 1640]|uniref:fasciclin domain-containing protein n=1 Tax=Subsaxibacter sp. CAU 1640 TaxID=2933271 RepID=UPI0020053B0F|nr:fasciclin domain-containing protein [Subsaxibacter sp. CAU 1640]MCK7589003.1 fasciclin domain-containing protein [Subsaxibacter sp. CAU 1640]
MKIKDLKIVTIFLLTIFLTFTSCKDEQKEADKARVEAERVEMESAKKAEQERLEREAKENAAKEEARANSITGKAMKNEDLTTLVTALQSADLTNMLSEPGNYTVFAPSNHAFEKLPEKKREELMKPENKQMLKEVLQYHVLPGKISPEQLADAIKNNKGSYKVKTVKGDELTLMMDGDQYVIKDATGKKAQVVLGNQPASNGVVYVIDTVLMSKK